jgi:hypothetical protein
MPPMHGPLGGMQTVLYYLGLACLFTHELDAVTHSEWRLLFILRDIPDPGASSLFVSLHVPLFFGILWLSHHRLDRVRNATRIAVALFLGVHGALHFLLSSAPASEFHGPLSVTLITTASVFGFAYLLLQWWPSSRAQR